MRAIAIVYTPHLVRVNAALAAVIALSALLYGIFLLEAVGNTAQRTAVERQATSLLSKISLLEAEYLVHTRTLTAERAQSLGFVAPVDTTTVYASAPARSVSVSSGIGGNGLQGR